MGHVLRLLSIPLVAPQLFDDQGRRCGLDGDLGGSVLALELDHDSDSFPLASLFDNILAYLLGIEAKRTQLGSKCCGRSCFSTENFNVDYDYGLAY